MVLKRNLTESIKTYLGKFPCVVILGARQVGKTTLLKTILPKAKFFDLERLSDYDYINSDPELFLDNHKNPIVVDEAQLCPNLFKSIRVKIDENRNQTGRYLLSGSSSPLLMKNISESLAGRVAIIEIPSLSWDEALEKPKSKFSSIFLEPSKYRSLRANFTRGELFELCFYGLYPEPFLKRKDKVFYQAWQENYFKTYIERDIRSLFPDLEIENYRRFIQMLIQSSGDTIKYSNFATSLSISEPTVKKYLEIAEGTFIWKRHRAFDKNSTKRLIKMPKGYLSDNILINYMYRFNDVEQMLSHSSFGMIWEGFIIMQLQKQLNLGSENYKFYYYRTQNKAEIDLVVSNGQVLIPIEIKSGTSIKNDQLISMKNFMEEYSSPFGIVINNGTELREISKNIFQVPAVYL